MPGQNFIIGIIDDTCDRDNDIIINCHGRIYFSSYTEALVEAQKLKNYNKEVIITTDKYLSIRSADYPELHALWSNRDITHIRDRFFCYSPYEWELLSGIGSVRHHKQSIYFDMDGVLCKWYPNQRGYNSLEEIIDPRNHYFKDTEPHRFMIELANMLCDMDYDVCIISAAARETIRDKTYWIGKHMPFIREQNIFFAPLGSDKTKFVKNNADMSVLIDDYNKNLSAWAGAAIKAINSVNSHQDRFPEIDIYRDDIESAYMTILSALENCSRKAV